MNGILDHNERFDIEYELRKSRVNQGDIFLLGVSYLTLIKSQPQKSITDRDFAQSLKYFPAIGFGIGFILLVNIALWLLIDSLQLSQFEDNLLLVVLFNTAISQIAFDCNCVRGFSSVIYAWSYAQGKNLKQILEYMHQDDTDMKNTLLVFFMLMIGGCASYIHVHKYSVLSFTYNSFLTVSFSVMFLQLFVMTFVRNEVAENYFKNNTAHIFASYSKPLTYGLIGLVINCLFIGGFYNLFGADDIVLRSIINMIVTSGISILLCMLLHRRISFYNSNMMFASMFIFQIVYQLVAAI